MKKELKNGKMNPMLKVRQVYTGAGDGSRKTGDGRI